MNNTTAPLTITYDAIMRQLLEFNLQMRARLAGERFGMTPPVYASDMCSISAGVGRQTGKSNWILWNATEDDIIVVYDQQIRELFLRRTPRNLRQRIFTAREVLIAYSNDDHAPPFDRCFIDDVDPVFQRVKRKHLYKWAVREDDKTEHTFFLMG